MRKRIGALGLAVAAALAAPAVAGAEWFGGFEAGAVYDDNLSRSELDADVESDRALRLFADGGRAFVLEDGKAVSFTGSVEVTAFDEFDGMDSLALGVSGSFRKKFGLGVFAPSLRALVSVQRLDFDTANRDGWLILGELRWMRRLSERWDVEAAVSYEVRSADQSTIATDGGPGPGPGPEPGDETKPGDVFDQERVGASVLGNVALGGAWLLSVGYGYLDGETDSNALPNDPIIAAAEAITDDPVFGAGRVAYRLEAAIHTLSLDLTRGLTEDSSLALGLQVQEIRADGGIDYDRTQARLTYIHAF